MKNRLASLIAFASILGSASVAYAEHMTSDADLLTKLRAAAPAAVLQHATITNMGADGKMKVIQQGTNGWTCMDPGQEPMCADKAAMDWVKALMAKKSPPAALGFVYMLDGDNGVSNTNPYDTKETADNNWIKTGPHVMIVGGDVKLMAQGYPRKAKGDPTEPYVMWPDTPYEHLMLPVK